MQSTSRDSVHVFFKGVPRALPKEDCDVLPSYTLCYNEMIEVLLASSRPALDPVGCDWISRLGTPPLSERHRSEVGV